MPRHTSLVLVALLAPTGAAADKVVTHPPQRPLPAPRVQPLTKGPAFYVDPAKGDDAADGSRAKPWRTAQHGVTRLKPGDTLYLRGGVYHERVYLTRSGTPEAPVTVASYPGELAVLDGGLKEFLLTPAASWEPFKGGAPDEYVSTKTYPRAADRRVPHQFPPGAWEPLWGIEDDRPLALGHFADSLVPLHGYRTAADLRAANELQPKDKKGGEGVYCGPGLWFNRETNRVHCRLAHHKLPGLGDRAYRGETDPRKLPLVVAAGFGDDVLRVSGVRHVRVEGLVLRGATGSPTVHVYGSEGIHLDHVTVYGGFPGLLVNASKGVRVTHAAFRGLAAPWTGRAHMKYRGTASYQIVLQNNQPVNEDVEFAHCEFTDDHDFAFLRYAKNLRFHHNFVDNFNDDGLEFGPKLRWHTAHVHHNRIGACLGVFQQHEIDKDESPADHDPDSGLYVYRNVFDQRAGVYYQLPAQPDPTGAFLRSEGHLLSDHGSPVYPVMRVYHNTFLRREPVFRDYFLFGLGATGLKNTERDVFNNLFVQADRVPGAVVLGKEAGRLREGGNILWGVKEGPAGGANPFAKFRASPLFAASREFHPPGWTTDDRVADPKFVNLTDDPAAPSDLRLSKGSAAVDAGLPLPAKWPDPLREADAGQPDVGAVPFGSAAWGVGVDGRIPLFGGPPGPVAATDLYARDNLVAWCIVPFDAKKRSPAERVAMLQRLGFKKYAYDWRAEHLPTFDEEVGLLKKAKIELTAVWFPANLGKDARAILDVLKKHEVKTQLWVTVGGGGVAKSADEQTQKVRDHAKVLRPIAEEAAKLGCSVALYNHGGWFGDPANQVAVVKELSLPNVGVVYNLHHGHDHLDRLPELLKAMKPHLLAFNLNGTAPDGERKGKKILPLGQGELDLKLLKLLADSGWAGPVGVLGHTNDDAEERLRDNLDGLDWLVPQLSGAKPGPKPTPRTYKAQPR